MTSELASALNDLNIRSHLADSSQNDTPEDDYSMKICVMFSSYQKAKLLIPIESPLGEECMPMHTPNRCMQSYAPGAKQQKKVVILTPESQSHMPPPFNDTYRMNHTCLHVKDPEESVKFYEQKFGMKHFQTLKPEGFKVTLYLLAYDTPKHPFHGVNFAAREGVLELCYSEDTPADFEPANGNTEPYKGFGHICVSVDNIEAACATLEKEGVVFKKKLTDGRQKDIAFALDPNNYWIELIEHGKDKKDNITDKGTWLFNHSMIRVKDPVKSLEFYQNVLGMKLFSKREFPNAEFDLYFLGYDHTPDYVPGSDDKKFKAARQAIVELTHNYGTENDKDFKYFTGNEKVHGFGHLAVSCNNPDELVAFMKEKAPETVWTMEYNSKGLPVGFFNDPDGYSVEVLWSNAFT